MMSEIGNMKRDCVRNRNITPLLSLKLPQLQPSLSPRSCKCPLLDRYLPPLLLLRTCDATETHVVHVPSTSHMTHKMGSQSLCVLACREGICRTNSGRTRLVECGLRCRRLRPLRAC